MLRATLPAVLLVCSLGCTTKPTVTSAPASAQPAPAVEPPRVWLDLEPGPHRVGYRHELRFDPTRRYHNPLVETPGRPISIHRWYPAEASGEPMRVGDYVELDSDESPEFAALLERHARRVLVGEVLELPSSLFASAEDRVLADAALAEPVHAWRDANPLPGRWPIVLYHPGLGGLYSDSFVLFELLASHGYLVVSSSYVPDGRMELGIGWEPKISIADLDFLRRELGTSGEWSSAVRVAVMGHSYGAQAALIYAMEGRSVDAVISIDSTIENGDPAAPWFRTDPKTATWLDRGAQIEVPSLILASSSASNTVFVDSLTASDHYYVTIPVLDHNDFLSHGGVLRTLVAHHMRGPEAPSSTAFAEAHAWQLRTIHAFLDGVLKADATRLASLDSEWAAGLDGASITYTAARESISQAELVARLELDGVAGVVTLCEPPGAEPRCTAEVALDEIARGYMHVDLTTRAIALLRELVERYPDSARLHNSLGEALMHVEDLDAAIRAFDRAVELAKLANDPNARGYEFWLMLARRAAGSR